MAAPAERTSPTSVVRLAEGTAATKPLNTLQLAAPIELPCASGESGPLCDRTAAIADVAQRFGAEVGATEAQLVSECSNGTPVPGNTQQCDIPVPKPITVYAAFGHMHLLGRSIKVELNPDTAQARTPLDVPSFDFDDQKLQPLPAPVDLNPGDTLRVTCTHDATLRRQLPALSKLPPRYVVWGDGSSDEMCLGLLTATVGE
jgi:Copper type II ascorbate-dependent monooxygenase, C-terminal domain